MKQYFILLLISLAFCTSITAQNKKEQVLWDAQQIVMYSPNEYKKLQRKMQILKRDTSVQGIINRLSTLCMVEPQRITSDKAEIYYSVELQIEFTRLCKRESFVLPNILNYYNKQANVMNLFYSTDSYHYWTLEELKELCSAEMTVYNVMSSAKDLYNTIEERNAIITANMNHYCFIERKLFGNPTYMIMQEHRCLPDTVKHNIEQITQIQDIYNNIDAAVQKLKIELETVNNDSDASHIVSHALDILTFIAYYGSNNEVKEYSSLLQNSFNLVYGSESLAHLQEIVNKWAQSLFCIDFLANYVSSSFTNYRSYSDSIALDYIPQFIQLEDSLRNVGYDFVDVHPVFYEGEYLNSDVFHSYRQQKAFIEYVILREIVDLSVGFLQNILNEQYRTIFAELGKEPDYYSIPLEQCLNLYVYNTCIDIVSVYTENPSPWLLDAMDLIVELYSQLVTPDGFYDYQFDALYRLATTIPYSDTQLRICENMIIPLLWYNDFSRMGLNKTEVMQAYAYALSTVAAHDKDSAWSIEADRIYKLSQSLPLYDGMWIRYYLNYVYTALNDRGKATLLIQKEYNKTKYLPKEYQQYMRDFWAIILACSYADSREYDLMIKYMNCVEDFSMLERYQELLIFAYAYLGDETKMKKYLNKYIKEVQHNVQVDLFNCSGEKSGYLDEVIKYSQTMYNSYSIAANDECKQLLAAACYDITLMTKSILLSVSHQIEDQLAHHPSELIRQQFAHYQELINKPTFNMSVAEKVTHQMDISNTNRTLYSNVREWYDTHEPTFTIYSWQDVRNSLGKDSVAIEFIKYEELNDSVFHYCALALRHDMTYPQCIYLGTDSMFSAAKEGKQIQSIFDMNNLSSLIWSPLIDSLSIQPSEHIFFAADGDLYQIPIEYLPYNATQTMSDVFNMHRVSSTRNIVPLATDTVRDEITLYGGLIYSMDSVTMKQNATQSVKYVNRDLTIEESFGDSLRATRAYINYLPGTLEEINTIKQYFSDTIILTGTMGTEESFKAMSGKGSHILHIGTHGYYLRPSSPEVKYEGLIDYSMSRTGLLLAGAQLAWNGEPVPDEVEDGILTAKEISTLDLQNVQIAVLSACETGTGEITSDGVAGLQRGFKKAGVQTIIMSLWKVDDNATQLLMKEFYRHWMSGKSKHEALRMAQNAVRYAVDEDGDRMFEDPVYWAAFIMLD